MTTVKFILAGIKAISGLMIAAGRFMNGAACPRIVTLKKCCRVNNLDSWRHGVESVPRLRPTEHW